MSEKINRCFISLELPTVIKDEALRIQHRLIQSNTVSARYTAPENIHLTLKFLGEIPLSLIHQILQKLELFTFEAPIVKMGHVGVFSKHDVRIIWLHLKGVDALQKQVDDLMEEWFKPEDRFMSHITLARVKKVIDKQKLFTFIDEQTVDSSVTATNRIHLMKSTLTPNGPIYEIMNTIEAQK